MSFNLNGTPEEVYQNFDFSGGLNTTNSNSLLQANELADLLNVTLSERGKFKKRPGLSILSNNTYPNERVENFAPAGAVEPVQTIRFTHRDGTGSLVIFYSDGSINSVSVNGTTGVSLMDPDTNSILQTNTSIQNSTGFGGNVAFNRLRYSHFQYQDPNNASKNLLYFGNAANGWFKYNGGSFATLVKSIPKCNFGMIHRNRAFFAGAASAQDRFYWSKLFQPETVDQTTNLKVWGAGATETTTTAGGGLADITSTVVPITGLTTFKDAVIIFKKDGVWTLSGSIPDEDFKLQRLNIAVGCTDPFSITKANNRLIYKGLDGIYSIYSPFQEAMENVPLSEKITPNLKNLTNIHSLYHDQKYYLFSDEQTLVWDERLNAWTKWDVKINHALYDEFAGKIVLSGKRVYGETEFIPGYLFTFTDDLLADEIKPDTFTPITSYVTTSYNGFGIPHITKKFKWIKLFFKPNTKALSTGKLYLYVDYKEQIKEFGTEYNNLIWEDDGDAQVDNNWGEYFGEPKQEMSKKIRFGGAGEQLQVTFYNNKLYEELEIHGYVVGFKPKTKVR